MLWLQIINRNQLTTKLIYPVLKCNNFYQRTKKYIKKKPRKELKLKLTETKTTCFSSFCSLKWRKQNSEGETDSAETRIVANLAPWSSIEENQEILERFSQQMFCTVHLFTIIHVQWMTFILSRLMKNPVCSWILRFLWRTMIREILD